MARPVAPAAPAASLVPPSEPPAPDPLPSELRAARQALRESEQQRDLIEELAGLGSWEIDLATDEIRWSREQRRIHGVDEAGAPRTHAGFMAMVVPEDRRTIEEAMAALADGAPRTVEFRVRRPDGAVRMLQARARLVPDADGRPTRVLGTSLDVTEQRDARRVLREREEQVARLERLAAMGSWEMDMESGRSPGRASSSASTACPSTGRSAPRPTSSRSSTPTTGRASST
jgi:PAS domain S-box-containing protein